MKNTITLIALIIGQLFIALFFSFNLFSQIPVEQLNDFVVKRVADKDFFTGTELNRINNLSTGLWFFRIASNKKGYWSNGRPNKGTGYGSYDFGYVYECHWKNYKIDGKLTIKYNNFIVFEGTAKDGIIQQGILYRFEKYPDGLYRYPKYYGKFVPKEYEKKDTDIYYNVKGVKFFLDNEYGYGDFPHLKDAFGGYMLSDAYDSRAYYGALFYYKNVASKKKNPDWRLLYKFAKGRGYENISYEQLHNYETANAKFYSKQPKYYVKCPNKYLRYYDECQVISTKTNLPIKFKPSHITHEYIKIKPKDNKVIYVYYDDEDWQKRIAFIAAEKAEKERIEKIKKDAIKFFNEELKREKELYNTSQEPLTYTKNGETYLEKKFFNEKPFTELKVPIIFYETEKDMLRQENESSYDVVYLESSKNAKENWETRERLDGYFKGKFYYTNDSITMVKGKYCTSKLIDKASFSRGNLLYIGIVFSHNLFPSKNWSSILK